MCVCVCEAKKNLKGKYTHAYTHKHTMVEEEKFKDLFFFYAPKFRRSHINIIVIITLSLTMFFITSNVKDETNKNSILVIY